MSLTAEQLARAECAKLPIAITDRLFWPERGHGAAAARRICADCPIKIECAERALDLGIDFGVWGGMTERERRALKKQRCS